MSSRVPALTPRDVIRVLERRGFFVHRIAGSHHVLKHPSDPQIRVVVALHRRELHPGTVRRVIKDAGMTIDDSMKAPAHANAREVGAYSEPKPRKPLIQKRRKRT